MNSQAALHHRYENGYFNYKTWLVPYFLLVFSPNHSQVLASHCQTIFVKKSQKSYIKASQDDVPPPHIFGNVYVINGIDLAISLAVPVSGGMMFSPLRNWCKKDYLE